MRFLKDFRESDDFMIKLLMIVCAVVLFSLNLIRAFDSNYWCDESFSYLMANKSIPNMIFATAMDVHPPLYYLYLNIFCDLFGLNGPVLHISTLVPYALILYVAYSRIYKRFGLCPALMMMVFASILPIAVRYNADIRMYVWMSFFMLLIYLVFYDILETNNKKYYKWFAIYSLLAMYTHYYCTVAVGMLCLILLILNRKDQDNFKSAKKTVKIIIVGYLPWAAVLLRSFIIASTDFWIDEIPSFSDCILFLFDGRASAILVAIMFISAGAVIAFNLLKKKKMDNFSIWIVSGIAVILFTSLIGVVMSHLIRPMFLMRYSYMTVTIAWLILSLCITKMNSKTIKYVLTAGVLVIVLVASVPEYCEIYEIERQSAVDTERTLEKTQNLISNKDVVLTDVNGIKSDVIISYYSCSRIFISLDDLPDLDINTRYWMFLADEMTDGTRAELNGMGFDRELIMDDGSVGSVNDAVGNMHYLPGNKCHIYRLVPL